MNEVLRGVDGSVMYWVDEAAYTPDAMLRVPMCRVCSLVLQGGVCREHGDRDAQVAHLQAQQITEAE